VYVLRLKIFNFQEFVSFHQLEVATKIQKVVRNGDTGDRKHQISKILRDAAKKYQTFDADNDFLRFLYVLKFKLNAHNSGLMSDLEGNPHCHEIHAGYQHVPVRNYFTIEFRSFQMKLMESLSA
jgi:hypothetical protein